MSLSAILKLILNCKIITEYVSMNDVTILPTQLFDYLLTYGKNYNMNTFCMMPQYSNDISEVKIIIDGIQNKFYRKIIYVFIFKFTGK